MPVFGQNFARLPHRRTCCSPQNSRSDNSAHHHCSSAGKVTRSSAMQRHRRSISFMIAQYTAAASMRAGLRMVSACRCNAWGSTDQLSAISAWYCCHALVCLVIFSAAFPQNPAFVKPSYHIPHRTAISEPTSALFSRDDGWASGYAPCQLTDHRAGQPHRKPLPMPNVLPSSVPAATYQVSTDILLLLYLVKLLLC